MFGAVGKRLMSADRIDDAICAFEMNTKHFPGVWDSWTWYASALMEKGRFEEALKACEKALEISPYNGFIDQLQGQIKSKRDKSVKQPI